MARQSICVLEQNVEANTQSRGSSLARDRYMAENLRWIAHVSEPSARIVAWAHNGQIANRTSSGLAMEHMSRPPHGNDVLLGGGVHPQADCGRFVMLPEVAHVVQGCAAEPTAQATLEVGSSSYPAEQKADYAADAALDGQRTQIQRRVPARITASAPARSSTTEAKPGQPAVSQPVSLAASRWVLTRGGLPPRPVRRCSPARRDPQHGRDRRNPRRLFLDGLGLRHPLKRSRALDILEVVEGTQEEIPDTTAQ